MNNKSLCGVKGGVPLTTLAVFAISVNLGAQETPDDSPRAMETIEVTAQAANASSAIERQRASDKVVSVLTSEAIGSLPDANVSEALQRIPGVFIERDQGEGRFVGVRGIDPNLNAASINGMGIPAPERDRRSVALDVIPSDLLSSLEVFKTLTPDMSADSIGGAIEIKSLNAFDRDGRSVKMTVENGYSALQEETSPKLSGAFTEVFELDGRELGVALAASWQQRNFGSENIETDGVWQPLTALDGSEAVGATELEQRDYTVTRERTGLVANFDYRPNDSTEFFLRSLYSDFSDEEQRQRNSFKLDEENDEPDTIAEGFAVWSGAALEKELKDRSEEQKIFSVVAGGEHSFAQWGVNYSLGYSQSEENEPGRRDTTFVQEGLQLGYTRAGERPQLTAGEAAFTAANYELDELVVENNFTEDGETSFRLDISRELQLAGNPSSLQFGLSERRRKKSDDVNATVYDGFGGDYTLADFAADNLDYSLADFGPAVNRSALNRFISANIDSFDIDATDTALNSTRDYKVEEDVSALDVMNSIDFGNGNLVYGLRYEATEFRANGWRAVESDDAVEGATQVAEDVYVSATAYQREYHHIFPSVNLKYQLSDNILLRGAYTESLARPSFGYLNPSPAAVEYDDGELEVEAGNPNLDPFESQNLDFSFEYYADTLGMFSVGVFYKNIDHFIAIADVADRVDLTQFLGGLPIEEAQVLQPINGDTATLTGAELAWTRGFDNGLLLKANATFTDSEAQLDLGHGTSRSETISLPQQADTVANLILGYERDAFSMRLSAAFRGARLLELDLEDAAFDLYEDDHLQFDLTAKYSFQNGVQLSFSGINLTDEPFYANRNGFNGQYEEYGPSYVLGLTYSNF
ncbi:TonB-dependent receptor [Microbulbifer sp. TYP-18]|uniref:TonB-dependent receptor n=1 Tax=Microbulbifer sp. TYP-18 TaxID=3230024 RepID=UPI0034C5D654